MSKDALGGMRKAQKRNLLPDIDLLPQIEYAGKKIDAAIFGPGTYNNNVARMGEEHRHSDALSNVTFKPLSTAESLAVASYNFAKLAKPMIFDLNWLQAGRILRAQEGVWANLPQDGEGKLITDERELKKSLGKAQRIKVGSGYIYLGDNDFGFAEYGTFASGIQDADTFVQGGLARVLEHTPEQAAENLKLIASERDYSNGVFVWVFNSVKKPVLKVVRLGSGRDFYDDRLDVVGGLWYGNDGYAFGGLVSGEASAPKK